jgi:GntR family transcriptional regulator/MocR family aminotransferase
MSIASLADYLAQHLERPADDGRSLRGARPMNRQLYELIREAILSQRLAARMQVPSSRELARELAVSRNTVAYAYDQLLAEGYFETRASSGTFVTDTAPDGQPLGQECESVPARRGGAPLLSTRGAALLRSAGAHAAQWGAFMPGVPDVTLFPNRIWRSLQNAHWTRSTATLLTYSSGGGYAPLREAIASWLRVARSVSCESRQVIITTGVHQSIDLLTRLLGEHGDHAWIEDPCYWGTRNVLQAQGIVTTPMPVDAEGLQIRADAASAPRFIFTTPSHQYPLGPVMSLSRRRALLEFAAVRGAWIVEDDYDSEFHCNARPLASLQGMDRHERVLYMGTFSKTMFPGLRIGFLVVPPALADAFATGVAELYRGGQVFTQAVLADFIAEGHFQSHVRRMRVHYARRLALLRAAIHAEFGDSLQADHAGTGLHLTLRLPRGVDDVALSRRAAEEGIIARPLSPYYHQPQYAPRGLILGYACVPDAQIAPCFARLVKAIRQGMHAGCERHPERIAEGCQHPVIPAEAGIRRESFREPQ